VEFNTHTYNSKLTPAFKLVKFTKELIICSVLNVQFTGHSIYLSFDRNETM